MEKRSCFFNRDAGQIQGELPALCIEEERVEQWAAQSSVSRTASVGLGGCPVPTELCWHQGPVGDLSPGGGPLLEGKVG